MVGGGRWEEMSAWDSRGQAEPGLHTQATGAAKRP